VIELLPDTTYLEARLVQLEKLYEKCDDASMTNETKNKCVKYKYDKSIHPRVFSEGDLVLVYDHDKDTLGACKFNPMWHDPYIVRCSL
jgi:hypothetical protein